MLTVVVDYALLTVSSKSPAFDFQLHIFLETPFHTFRKVFHSRSLRYEGGPKKVPIHEQFPIDLEGHSLFLKAKLLFNNSPEVKVPSQYYLLSKPPDGNHFFLFELAADLKIQINYRLESGSGGPWWKGYQDDDSADQSEDSPSMIELIRIAKVFMKRVSPIRKIQWQVEKEVSRLDSKRDLKLLGIFALYLFCARWVLLAAAITLCFYKPRDRLRIAITDYTTALFQREEASVETANNLVWIKQSMEMVIDISAAIKRLTFVSPDMGTLFRLLRSVVSCLLFFAAVHTVRIEYILLAAACVLYVYKYRVQLKEELRLFEGKHRRLRGYLKQLDQFISRVQDRLAKRKISKTIFFRENESKNFGKYDKSALSLICGIKSQPPLQ